jgi:hypothetical protein
MHSSLQYAPFFSTELLHPSPKHGFLSDVDGRLHFSELMWAFCCTLSVFNFSFSLAIKERFGSFDETMVLDHLDADPSWTGAGCLLHLDRVVGPLEEDGSRLDTATDETDSVASFPFHRHLRIQHFVLNDTKYHLEITISFI